MLVLGLISIGHLVWCQQDGIDQQLIFPLSSGMESSSASNPCYTTLDAQYPGTPCNNRLPQPQPQPYYKQQMNDYNLYSPYPYMGQRGQPAGMRIIYNSR